MRKQGTRIDLVSRQGNLLNRAFPDIVAAVARVSGDFVLDCELTVDDPTGHSLFGQLLSRARKSEPSSVRHAIAAHPARLYVFDMLATGNRSIRELPLIERKRWLRDSFTDSAALVFVNGVIGAGHQVFALAQTHQFEGMVGKRLSSPYRRGRSPFWIKVKDSGYVRPAAPQLMRDR